MIKLQQVHVAFPGTTREALSNITLEITPGEHVCILGKNGSGKSTLLQLINALVLPSKGSVNVLGLNTLDPTQILKIRRNAAYVFQHPEDQMVTSIVADDTAFGPENCCVPQPEIVQRVDEALAAVNISAHAQADPADLSGGQQQRVALAGALAMKPQILLLDEPCAMLDIEGRRAVASVIAELSRLGITIVHVTHFMEDALTASRVCVLDQGHLAFDGTPEAFFADEAQVKELSLEMPRAERKLSIVPNDLPRLPLNKTDIYVGSETKKAAISFVNVCFSYAQSKNPRKQTLGLVKQLASKLGASKANKANKAGKQSAPTQQAQKQPQSNAPLALSNLSFSVPHGSITALIGHTGSGKSTAAELACALKLPLSGRVEVNGIDTCDFSKRRELRSQVGYVSQLPEHQLFAETVFDDVTFGPKNLGLSSAEVQSRVRESLAQTGLTPSDELLARSPFALSGGQQRCVALAGVLAMQQPILILDEPMAGLDPQGRAHIRALIRSLKERGTTLLMVTHSIDDVLDLADQVIELSCGKLIAKGKPMEVSTHVNSR